MNKFYKITVLAILIYAACQQTSVAAAPVVSVAPAESYTDKATGITIDCPNGWMSFAPVHKSTRTQVQWSRGGLADYPVMIIEPMGRPVSSSAKELIDNTLAAYQKKEPINIVEKPHEVVFNDIHMYKMVTDSHGTLRNATYIYAMGHSFRIVVLDSSDHYAETEAEVEAAFKNMRKAEKA